MQSTLLNAGRGCEGKYPVCLAEEERVGSPQEPEGQAWQQLHCLDPGGCACLSWVPVWVEPGGCGRRGPAQIGCGMLGYQQAGAGMGLLGPRPESVPEHTAAPTSHPQRRPPPGVRAELPMPTPLSELRIAGSQHF